MHKSFKIVMKSSLSSLVACVLDVTSKKSLPNPRSNRLTPMFSSKSFPVLALVFRSLIHFVTIFVYGVS